jgi:hypothetical protein
MSWSYGANLKGPKRTIHTEDSNHSSRREGRAINQPTKGQPNTTNGPQFPNSVDFIKSSRGRGRQGRRRRRRRRRRMGVGWGTMRKEKEEQVKGQQEREMSRFGNWLNREERRGRLGLFVVGTT